MFFLWCILVYINILPMKKLIYILFGALLLAPVTGELWRLSLMGFEFLPSDLLIPPLFVVWVVDKIKNDRKLRLGKIGKMIVIFLFVVTLTYLINLYRFDLKQMIVAFSVMIFKDSTTPGTTSCSMPE